MVSGDHAPDFHRELLSALELINTGIEDDNSYVKQATFEFLKVREEKGQGLDTATALELFNTGIKDGFWFVKQAAFEFAQTRIEKNPRFVVAIEENLKDIYYTNSLEGKFIQKLLDSKKPREW